ncbi:MAG TPA: DUF309 domain-containing protein [Gammaproteobacteria bacterium]
MLHPKKYAGASHIPPIPLSVDAFNAQTWRCSQRYLYAIDLFNHRYWWEAHEVLEEVWLEAGRRSATGKFIQGLIQIAAALLKESQSIHKGAHRLAVSGLAKICLQSGVFLGIDIDALGKQVEACILHAGTIVPHIELKMD